EAAERDGYDVRGLAPTSRATQKVAEAGITAVTLQSHLSRPANHEGSQPRLYMLDESSLASTRQMHAFLGTLHGKDHVILVGDTRQHHAVEAGQPFRQLQDAGMTVVRLDAIVRQQDPALKEVVEHLARGEVIHAVRALDVQKRLYEFPDRAS